tara:strand:+ start:207 stop:428 length:222 start_codon:yes stop_codon:yes gene_type:complete
MLLGIESVIYYLVFLDSVGANISAWFLPGFVKWYKKKFPLFSKHTPLTKGWAFIYLALVLWVGWSLYRLGILF